MLLMDDIKLFSNNVSQICSLVDTKYTYSTDMSVDTSVIDLGSPAIRAMTVRECLFGWVFQVIAGRSITQWYDI